MGVAGRVFGFIQANLLCFPGALVNVVEAGVKVNLTFVWKCELRVLVSVKQKGCLQRPTSGTVHVDALTMCFFSC